MKKAKTVILWILLIISLLLVVAALTGMSLNEDVVAVGNDIILYKASMTFLFGSITVCFVIALIGCYVPHNGSVKKSRKALRYIAICALGLVAYSIAYAGVSEEFKSSMGIAPSDVIQEPANETMVLPETEDESEDASPDTEDQSEVDASPETGTQLETEVVPEGEEEVVPPGNEFVTEANPLIFTFADDEYKVGVCGVVLNKVAFVCEPYKAYSSEKSTYAKYIRVYVTIRNNSAKETFVSARKPGSVNIGLYHGPTETINVGWNNAYRWKFDADAKVDYGFTLAPNETREVCVSGVYINEEQLKYTDTPSVDFYFVNENEMLTVPIN